jgi:hypothetical protein
MLPSEDLARSLRRVFETHLLEGVPEAGQREDADDLVQSIQVGNLEFERYRVPRLRVGGADRRGRAPPSATVQRGLRRVFIIGDTAGTPPRAASASETAVRAAGFPAGIGASPRSRTPGR